MTSASLKKQKALLADLFSAKKETVMAALKKIPEEGTPEFIIPLLRTFKAWPHSTEVRAKVTFILYHLKTPEAVPELMKALDEPDLQEEKAFILSVFWNSGHIPTDISVLVGHALRGGYMVALEVMTLLEQMEDTADAEEAREASLDVQEYLDEHPNIEHGPMLAELNRTLIKLSNL